jgi:imidazole glycerol-phosphate synthase subunit HisF
MFAKRIIPCLDCKDGRVVKGIQFVNLRDAGDPGDLAEVYDRAGADELVMLDISASREGRATLMDTVNRVARKLFIPLTVGGGVRTLEDGRRLLSAGSDKVAINTAAVERPDLISELASHFGRQAVVVAIDARRTQPALASRGAAAETTSIEAPQGNMGYSQGTSRVRAGTQVRTLETEGVQKQADPAWQVLTYGGTRETNIDALEWAERANSLGAGEILLTSMDADGTKAGFDCELTAAVANALPIPVIASGGAGSAEHFADVFLRGSADAALAASIFHYGTHTIRSLKEYLRTRGISVRL